MPAKKKRLLIAGGIVAGTALLVLVFLLVRGCGEKKKAATGTTPVKTTTAVTTTIPAASTAPTTTATATAPAGATTVSTPPATAPAPVPPPEIISRSVDPEVVDPGGSLTFSAEVRGQATSVTINAFKRDTGALVLTLPLVQGATVGDVTSWSAGTTAPAAKGEYRFFATATSTDGVEVKMPGVSGWTFCVGDPLIDCS